MLNDIYHLTGEMPEGPHSFERNKDRLSYTHQIVKIDLTQVKKSNVSLFFIYFLLATFIFRFRTFIYIGSKRITGFDS